MDRRQFLRHSAFFTVAAAGGVSAGPAAAGGETDFPHAYPQGVASGEPRETSLVFWTRCVRTAGDPAADVPLTLQVASDRRFGSLLAEVALTALARYDHTARAKITGLPPGSALYYRFIAGRDRSPVGRTRTAPAAGSAPAQVRFAWFNCQDWSVNHWGAMSLMLREELDFVVHVGDYIYETVGASFQDGQVEPAHVPIVFPDGDTLPGGSRAASTLADYRTLYRTYRSDPRLQALHAKFPIICIWDDHEFSDDCWRDHNTYTNANPQQTARRRAANQAWVEYQVVDFGDVSFDEADPAYDNLRLYRDFHFGNLVHLVMTDERLYRDDHVVPEAVVAQMLGHDPVNGNDSIGARYLVQQSLLAQQEAIATTQLGRVPAILGPTQTQWWKQTLAGSGAAWKVWGNELMLNRMWADLSQIAPPPYNDNFVLDCDAWDGYPSHKAELMGFLRSQGVSNVVAITGDLHAFQCGVVRDTPDPATGVPVLVDFVCAGISSTSFYQSVKAAVAGTPMALLTATPALFEKLIRGFNPDFVHTDHDAQGYATATVTPDHFVVVFNKVKPLTARGQVPAQPLAQQTRITVAAGTTTPVVG
jgi:alkaline phosphatase D